MTISPKKKKPVHAGLSITHREIELAVFSPKSLAVEQSYSIPVPAGLFDNERDVVRDPALLKELISQVLKDIKPRPSALHLSVPGTLLRLVEMPKMEPASLYLSLSSEAERYRTFDNTEASVDFVVVNNPTLPPNMQQLVLGAIRSDALGLYLRILKELKIKPSSIGLEPINILRGMASSGVLDGLIQQIGPDSRWGMIFVEPSRVRFSLWQCDQLLEFRELAMDTTDFSRATRDSLIVEDMLEEMRRTTKNEQPVLWLTHNMPPAMEQILSEILGCPVRPSPVGGSVSMPQPLQLATIGVALSSMVLFPFDLDIAEGMNFSGGAAVASAESTSVSGNETGEANWLIPAGVGSILLGGLISGLLFALAMFTAGQVPGVQSQVDSAKVEVAGLKSRQQELKKKAELDKTLLEMVQKAKIRNQVYVALTDDLRQKTPEQMWIQILKVTDKLEVDGKALNHKSVINFAKSFDAATYTKAVLIDAIKEGKLGGNLVYDFKISGGINLDKSLLENTDNANASSGGNSKNNGQSGV